MDQIWPVGRSLWNIGLMSYYTGSNGNKKSLVSVIFAEKVEAAGKQKVNKFV